MIPFSIVLLELIGDRLSGESWVALLLVFF
jgi:hypothetical protein